MAPRHSRAGPAPTWAQSQPESWLLLSTLTYRVPPSPGVASPQGATTFQPHFSWPKTLSRPDTSAGTRLAASAVLQDSLGSQAEVTKSGSAGGQGNGDGALRRRLWLNSRPRLRTEPSPHDPHLGPKGPEVHKGTAPRHEERDTDRLPPRRQVTPIHTAVQRPGPRLPRTDWPPPHSRAGGGCGRLWSEPRARPDTRLRLVAVLVFRPVTKLHQSRAKRTRQGRGSHAYRA